jgi:hypothetical protein
LLALLEQAKQHLAHLGEVGAHAADIGGANDFETVAVLGHQQLDGGDDFLEHLADVKLLEVKRHLAGCNVNRGSSHERSSPFNPWVR